MKIPFVLGTVAVLIFSVFVRHAVAADTTMPTTRDIRNFERTRRDDLQRNYDKQLDIETIRLKDTINEIDRYRALLRDATGRIETTPDSFHKAAATLDDQRAMLELEKIGAEARMKAIENEISRASENAAKQAGDDAAIVEFAKVVEARKKQFDIIASSVKSGMQTPAEVNQAEAALAEAQAQLALQKERVLAANGGDIIIGLQKQLSDLRIASAEREARLAYLQAQTARFFDVAKTLDRLETAQIDRQQYESRLRQIGEEIDRIETTPLSEPLP
jgi:hypothetical protein